MAAPVNTEFHFGESVYQPQATPTWPAVEQQEVRALMLVCRSDLTLLSGAILAEIHGLLAAVAGIVHPYQGCGRRRVRIGFRPPYAR